MITSPSGKYYLTTRSFFGREDEMDGEDTSYINLYKNDESKLSIAEAVTGFDQYTKFTSSITTAKACFSADEKYIFLRLIKFTEPKDKFTQVYQIELNKPPYSRLRRVDTVTLTEESYRNLENFTYDPERKQLISKATKENNLQQEISSSSV